jgi:hypothetical protein
VSGLFGMVAVFETPEAVRRAATELRDKGYTEFEAYTPYPVEGLGQIVRPGRKIGLPLIMFAAAIVGAALGYWIQYWDEAVSYPINVGGRPHNSWPAFTVSAFEIMLLVTVTAGLVGILAASRLPRLYHPIFEAEAFERASQDRFLLCLETGDPKFEAESVRRTFEELGASSIEEART